MSHWRNRSSTVIWIASLGNLAPKTFPVHKTSRAFPVASQSRGPNNSEIEGVVRTMMHDSFRASEVSLTITAGLARRCTGSIRSLVFAGGRAQYELEDFVRSIVLIVDSHESIKTYCATRFELKDWEVRCCESGTISESGQF